MVLGALIQVITMTLVTNSVEGSTRHIQSADVAYIIMDQEIERTQRLMTTMLYCTRASQLLLFLGLVFCLTGIYQTAKATEKLPASNHPQVP